MAPILLLCLLCSLIVIGRWPLTWSLHSELLAACISRRSGDWIILEISAVSASGDEIKALQCETQTVKLLELIGSRSVCSQTLTGTKLMFLAGEGCLWLGRMSAPNACSSWISLSVCSHSLCAVGDYIPWKPHASAFDCSLCCAFA